MVTGVQEAQSTIYSDKSGYFYEGMRREDVKPYNGIKSLFHDAKKDFDRIDGDHDGILSKDEITNNLYEEIQRIHIRKMDYSLLAGFSALSIILSQAENSKNPLTMTGFITLSALSLIFTGAALITCKKQENIEQKIADEYKYKRKTLHTDLKKRLRENASTLF